MQTVLIVFHLMVVLALVAVVLLQRSEGGALGVGGGSGFMTGRGQANVLTRATAILAAIFFATSLGLTLLAHYGHSNKSILENLPPGPSQPASTLPPKGEGTVLDQLRKLQEQRSGGGATPTITPATAPPPDTTTSGSRPPSPAPATPGSK